MKKTVSIILVLIMALSLIAGCSSAGSAKGGDIKLNYVLEDKDAYFFMDREYAVDADSVDTTEKELKKAEEYLTKYILEAAKNGETAFDFMIDDVTFSEDIANWTLTTEQTGDDETKTDWTLTYVKEGCPITVTVYATLYKEFAIIEWTVWLSNTGSEKSGQIHAFNALYDIFGEEASGEYRVTTFEGGHEDYTSFLAETKTLDLGKSRLLGGTGGKSSVAWSPYVNIQWANENADWGKEGVFISNGWSGQWSTKVQNVGGGVEVTAKQERLDTYLNPGEAIRSPLMTLLFWEKDLMRSQNLWRRWVYNVAMPQPDGEPIPTMIHGNTAQDTALTVKATTENQIDFIKQWVELGFDIDAWQMDAGWYDMANGSTAWQDTGSWEPSDKRFNGTLKPIADELDKHDIDFILWYEPERLVTYSDWHKQFKDTDFIIQSITGWHCFNLSSDEATDWLIDYMCDNIDRNGVDVYRQDCNLNDGSSLSSFWQELDEDGRRGYVENRYIINYLRYFDAIVEHTGTFIDNCASGGKRLDLESTKRAVALWRDDKCYEATLTQCQSWGINFFMPYSGQGSLDQMSGTMAYTFRSNMMTYTGFPWKLTVINDANIDLHKQVIEEHKTYAHYLTQDYYPLTPFSQEETAWMGWQYNDASDSTGIVQMFKRMESDQDSAIFYLNGLDAKTTYHVEDIDTGEFVELTGQQLMQDGVQINIQDEFGAKIFHYAPVA